MTSYESVTRELLEAIQVALPSWVERQVLSVAEAFGLRVDADLHAAVSSAGEACVSEVMPALTTLLHSDIDDQRVSPLSLLRAAVRFPTQVLADRGVPPIVRDEFEEANFPDDVYGLSPASFADLGPEVHEPGIAWGAAKAFVHLQRRRGVAP